MIDLDEARDRVGHRMNVDPEARMWTPEEIRFLLRHWSLFARQLEQCVSLADELAELEVAATSAPVRARQALTDGALWWLREAPVPLRILAVMALLFVYAFTRGLLS